MTAIAALPVLGKWRIVEADLWDRDYLDLVEPAHAYTVFAFRQTAHFAQIRTHSVHREPALRAQVPLERGDRTLVRLVHGRTLRA